MGGYIEHHVIGPLSFRIKKDGPRKYTLWMGGCRIGKPLPNGYVEEFTASTMLEVRCELSNAAKRELNRRIREREREVKDLKAKLGGHAIAKLDGMIWAAQEKKANVRARGNV